MTSRKRLMMKCDDKETGRIGLRRRPLTESGFRQRGVVMVSMRCLNQAGAKPETVVVALTTARKSAKSIDSVVVAGSKLVLAACSTAAPSTAVQHTAEMVSLSE
jgi:hypothetical protein